MSTHPLEAFRKNQTPVLSQAALAAMLQVKRVTVYRWEKGDRFPDRKHWPRIKEVTGLSADDLERAA